MKEGGFNILLPGQIWKDMGQICPRDGKILLRSSASSKKRICLGSGVWGVWNLLSQAKIFFDSVILGWGKQ